MLRSLFVYTRRALEPLTRRLFVEQARANASLAPLQTARFLGLVETLPIELDRGLDSGVALDLARTHRLSFYDAAYLELAERRSLPLATLDDARFGARPARRPPGAWRKVTCAG